jgi:hypothetical protein
MRFADSVQEEAAPAGLGGGIPRRALETNAGTALENLRSKEDFKLKIVILGPDGAGKSSVIRGTDATGGSTGRPRREGAPPEAASDSSAARRAGSHCHRPSWQAAAVGADFAGQDTGSGSSKSGAPISFMDRKQTLLICDRYYHDLLVDPLRYRYGGPLCGQPGWWAVN